jgi:hypothetical protein
MDGWFIAGSDILKYGVIMSLWMNRNLSKSVIAEKGGGKISPFAQKAAANKSLY